jgi:hypothetical protein
MDPATATIIGGLLALSGSIIVAALSSNAANRRDAKARREEIRKRHLERQIEEFYGPLLAISRRVEAVHEIRDKLFKAFEATGERSDGDLLKRVVNFTSSEYSQPSYAEIQEILTKKLHLLEDTNIPDSFQLFLNRTVQRSIQTRLWTQEHIDNSVVRGDPYPHEFSVDVARTFSLLMTEYRNMQGRVKTADVGEVRAAPGAD